MKVVAKFLFGTLLAAWVGLSSTGCETTQSGSSINPQQPWMPPSMADNGGDSSGDAKPPPLASVAKLRVEDKITVVFSNLPRGREIPYHEQRIREDGTITLLHNITVHAAGKTPGQLESEIREALVPNYYKTLTVTVRAEERTFYVGGEVRNPNRQPYTDRITTTRAIQSAGDFTDFANRRKIEIIRSNGDRLWVDWYDAKENPDLDHEIYPGDQIIVHKGIL